MSKYSICHCINLILTHSLQSINNTNNASSKQMIKITIKKQLLNTPFLPYCSVISELNS